MCPNYSMNGGRDIKKKGGACEFKYDIFDTV
jgi:hypothetical protein